MNISANTTSSPRNGTKHSQFREAITIMWQSIFIPRQDYPPTKQFDPNIPPFVIINFFIIIFINF